MTRQHHRERGRPSRYTEALATEILDRLAAGESLRKICSAGRRFPKPSTVIGWCADDRPPGFSERYARARRARAEEPTATAEVTAATSEEASTGGQQEVATVETPSMTPQAAAAVRQAAAYQPSGILTVEQLLRIAQGETLASILAGGSA